MSRSTGDKLAKLTVVVTVAEHSWTVIIDLSGVETIRSGDWMLKNSSTIVSVVDERGVGLEEREWRRVVVPAVVGALQIACMRAALAGMQHLTAASEASPKPPPPPPTPLGEQGRA